MDVFHHFPPKESCTCTIFLTWMVEHFFGFHCSPISSIADLVDFSTVFNLLSEAAKIFKSSIYNRSVTLMLIGLDSMCPSVALTFHVMEFIHRVNSLGHKASPWGRSLLNFIISDFSRALLLSPLLYSNSCSDYDQTSILGICVPASSPSAICCPLNRIPSLHLSRICLLYIYPGYYYYYYYYCYYYYYYYYNITICNFVDFSA